MTTSTTEWEHYDAAAIAIAAALAQARRPDFHDGHVAVARAAYDIADEMARESHRRRKLLPSDTLYDNPVMWVQSICDSEDHPQKNEVSMRFMMRMLEEGYPLGPTFQDAVASVEALTPENVSRFSGAALPDGLHQRVREHAAELLRKHFA